MIEQPQKNVAVDAADFSGRINLRIPIGNLGEDDKTQTKARDRFFSVESALLPNNKTNNRHMQSNKSLLIRDSSEEF